ncbi:unnamed protein product, partial [Owenia fusiformis]
MDVTSTSESHATESMESTDAHFPSYQTMSLAGIGQMQNPDMYSVSEHNQSEVQHVVEPSFTVSSNDDIQNQPLPHTSQFDQLSHSQMHFERFENEDNQILDNSNLEDDIAKPHDIMTSYENNINQPQITDDNFYNSNDPMQSNSENVDSSVTSHSEIAQQLLYGQPVSQQQTMASSMTGLKALLISPKQRIRRPKEKPKPQSNYELEQAYRILREIMHENNKSVNWPFMDEVDVQKYGLWDYHERIRKPIWLRKMKEKFENLGYTSITEYISDMRLMLENCYRYNGPDHVISKRGQKLETILEQKLTLLSREIREKCTIDATRGLSGALDDENTKAASLGLRRRNKHLTPHDSSKLLTHLRIEKQERLKEARRQHILEMRHKKDEFINSLSEWEDKLLAEPIKSQLKSMWELPQIGHFLYLCLEPLNMEEVVHYELERCFAMPKQSVTMQKIMTSLLSTPYQRTRLDTKPLMPYSVWEEKLSLKMRHWYKILQDSGSIHKTCEKLGLEPMFFKVLGMVNPLERGKYHELTYFQKVWVMKAMCDYCLENQESIRDAIEAQQDNERTAYVLGSDVDGNTYLHFPQFCGADVRIYRQSPITMPTMPKPKPQKVVPRSKSLKRPSRKPSRTPKKKMKTVVAKEVSPSPKRTRPSRLRQTIKPVMSNAPLEIATTTEDSSSETEATETSDAESDVTDAPSEVSTISRSSSVNKVHYPSHSPRMTRNSMKTEVDELPMLSKTRRKIFGVDMGDSDSEVSSVKSGTSGRTTRNSTPRKASSSSRSNSPVPASVASPSSSRKTRSRRGLKTPSKLLTDSTPSQSPTPCDTETISQSTESPSNHEDTNTGNEDITKSNDISVKAQPCSSKNENYDSGVDKSDSEMTDCADSDSETQPGPGKWKDTQNNNPNAKPIGDDTNNTKPNCIDNQTAASSSRSNDDYKASEKDSAISCTDYKLNGKTSSDLMETDKKVEKADTVENECSSLAADVAADDTKSEKVNDIKSNDIKVNQNETKADDTMATNEESQNNELIKKEVIDDQNHNEEVENVDKDNDNCSTVGDNTNAIKQVPEADTNDAKDTTTKESGKNAIKEKLPELPTPEILGPVEGEFELVVESVETLRELTEKFAEPAPVEIKGKKGKVTTEPVAWPKKHKELHSRLHFLLVELEPWDQKLLQANKKARMKLRKEFEDYEEEVKPEVNDDVWESEESASEESEEEEESNDEGQNEEKQKQVINKPVRKKKRQEDKPVAPEPVVEDEIDVSSRGRLRKRRFIPNNIEDQGLKPKKVAKLFEGPKYPVPSTESVLHQHLMKPLATSVGTLGARSTPGLSHLQFQSSAVSTPQGTKSSYSLLQQPQLGQASHQLIQALLANGNQAKNTDTAIKPVEGKISEKFPGFQFKLQPGVSIGNTASSKMSSVTASLLQSPLQPTSSTNKTQVYNVNPVKSLPPALIHSLLAKQMAALKKPPKQPVVPVITSPASAVAASVMSVPESTSPSAQPAARLTASLLQQGVNNQGQISSSETQATSEVSTQPKSPNSFSSPWAQQVLNPYNVAINSSKYPANATVKMLLERRQKSAVSTSNETSSSPSPVTVSSTGIVQAQSVGVSTALSSSSTGIVVSQVQGATQRAPIVAGQLGALRVISSPARPLLSTGTGPSQASNTALPIAGAKIRFPPSLTPASNILQQAGKLAPGMTRVDVMPVRSSVIDAAVKAVMTDVKTSLPTAHIKVPPSPLSVRSIQPRRPVTTTRMAQTTPIPASPAAPTPQRVPMMINVVSPGKSATVPPLSDTTLTAKVAIAQGSQGQPGRGLLSLSPSAGTRKNEVRKNVIVKIVPPGSTTAQ